MKSELTNRDTVTSSKSVKIAVIDLECTCNNDDIFGPHEIIEIGVILGNLSQEFFNIASELQIYVKPVINPALTEFCIELTGITQSTVDAAIILEEGLFLLEGWLQKHSVAAWVHGVNSTQISSCVNAS